jgi:hypothetical protein
LAVGVGVQPKVSKPYPFFFYTDHSQEADPDPLIPVTKVNYVLIILIKIHAVLSKPDLNDIMSLCQMPKPAVSAGRKKTFCCFVIRQIHCHSEGENFLKFLLSRANFSRFNPGDVSWIKPWRFWYRDMKPGCSMQQVEHDPMQRADTIISKCRLLTSTRYFNNR